MRTGKASPGMAGYCTNTKEVKGMVYKWKTGYHKVDAETAGKELERIKKKRGLTAEAVVDESRDPKARLHKEFEWNDVVAAEKFRVEQARHMIADIVVEADSPAGSTVTRGFVKLSHDEAYERVQDVLMDVEKTARLLDKAKTELRWFRDKYSTLKELAGVFAEIDKL